MGNLIWEPLKVWRGDLHCLMSCVKCFCHLYSILSCHPVPWWVPFLCHWVSSDKKHNYICQAVWKFTFILAYFLWIALDGSSVLIRLSMWESFFVESLQLWHLDNLSRQGVLFSLPGDKQSINPKPSLSGVNWGCCWAKGHHRVRTIHDRSLLYLRF